jgi:hypothetical protein
MTRTAWRALTPGFLLLLATCTESSAAYVGDHFFPSTLATTVLTPADYKPPFFYNPPFFVRLPDTATTPTTHEIDIPSRLVAETFRIMATDHIRTGRAGLI